MKQAVERGRKPSGRKLSDEDVQEIRRLLEEGDLTQKAIAERFDVWPSHVSRIKTGDRHQGAPA